MATKGEASVLRSEAMLLSSRQTAISESAIGMMERMGDAKEFTMAPRLSSARSFPTSPAQNYMQNPSTGQERAPQKEKHIASK